MLLLFSNITSHSIHTEALPDSPGGWRLESLTISSTRCETLVGHVHSRADPRNYVFLAGSNRGQLAMACGREVSWMDTARARLLPDLGWRDSSCGGRAYIPAAEDRILAPPGLLGQLAGAALQPSANAKKVCTRHGEFPGGDFGQAG